MAFTERCEEYRAIHSLMDNEIIPTLSSVLQHTAKDWWRADRSNILTWAAFKDTFLNAFLSKDHDSEAERRIRDRIQRPDEPIWDFAFQYHVLCLQWRPLKTEKEIVQATLRKCNPRITSLLRSTVTTVGEWVRVGTLIERDLHTAPEYWRKQSPKPNPRKEKRKMATVSLCVLNAPITVVSVSLSINMVACQAVLDSESTYLLILEAFWKKTQDSA